MDSLEKRSLLSVLGHRGVSIMALGLSGNGKTSLCRNLPPDETLWLVYDVEGLRVLKQWGWDEGHFELPRRADDWTALVHHAAMHDGYRYLVIDTLNAYYDQLLREWCDKHPDIPMEETNWDRWRYGLYHTIALLNEVFDLVGLGKHAIVLCHQKVPLTEKAKLEPDLPGQLPEAAAKRFDIICHSTSLWDHDRKQPCYVVEQLYGEHYSKDRYGLSWPRDNDALAIITEAQQVLTPKEDPFPAMNEKLRLLCERFLRQCETEKKGRAWGVKVLGDLCPGGDWSAFTIEHYRQAQAALAGATKKERPTEPQGQLVLEE